ncbi:MAG: hypothetical protein U5P10_09685 [Spirochaetia bacterium]|nr:hypothetical protein [Spirochaetia bacterium]
MDEKQLPKGILDKINEQIELFNQKNNIDIIDSIPDTNNIPKEGNKWLKINDVICVYTDMIGSTRLSAEQKYDSSTASAYELFTGTIIKIFHFYDASYVEVQGDGVFALFNKNEIYRSLVSAVTVKTFVEKSFIPLYKQRSKLDLGVHIGIDKKTVLVKKIGLRQKE